MSSGKETLYIKGERNTEVKKTDVTLGDLLEMECGDTSILNKIKTLKILKIQPDGSHRFVLSVLKLIERIHQEYPGLDVQNEGEADLIVTYEESEKRNAAAHFCKVAAIALITFLGAAFSIMSFNNDVSVTRMFDQIYELVMGSRPAGVTILELTYSLGLIVGILVFFNHFGSKRFSVDPTPMEVEMRLYEQDIQSTLVEGYSRKEKEIHVGQTGDSGDRGV